MQNDILKTIGANVFAKKTGQEKPFLTKDEYERMIRDTELKAKRGGGEHVRKVNGFICQKCELMIITVRLDAGPTPDQMLCQRGSGLCRGFMISAGYPPTIQHAADSASFEWFRPSYSFYVRIGNYKVRSFLDVGGLLIRRRGQPDPIGIEAMNILPMIIGA